MRSLRRRFVLDPSRGLGLGVCSGLAAAARLPVEVVRLGLLLGFWFALPWAVVAYVAGFMVASHEPDYHDRVGDAAPGMVMARIAVGMSTIAALAVAVITTTDRRAVGLTWALLVVGFGWAGRRSVDRHAD